MDILDNKIQQLSIEADALVKRKIELQENLTNIEIRLTQIVGALTELHDLQGKMKEDEITE